MRILVHGMISDYYSARLITYKRMRLNSSVWRQRLALVAMKLTRSRHGSAQDGEIS